MKKLFAVLTTVLVLAASGCAPTVDVEAERAALRDVAVQWAEAANEKDIPGILALYTAGASLLPPNAAIVPGAEAIRAMWAETVESPGYAVTIETMETEVSRSGDLGYSRSTYEVTVDDPEGNPVTDSGKWVVVCKKQTDGSWKIVIHIWNFDQPAASE
jgi:ketosteroid isomerase-like protein